MTSTGPTTGSVRKTRHELQPGDQVELRYGQTGTVLEVRDDRERTLMVDLGEGAILASSTWEVIRWGAELDAGE